MKCENYTYLQEQAEESLEECFSDTHQSPPSKSNHTVKMCCEPDSETESCQSSQSLETSEPLTGPNGEGQLTLFAADFPAKTSQQPEKAQESAAHALACGQRWRELLARSGLDLRLLKTPRCCGQEDLEPSSKTLPRWGMMRDGECWVLGMSVRRINGTECGCWPTPTRRDWKGTNAPEGLTRRDGKSRLDQLPNAVAYPGLRGGIKTPQKWATPCQGDYRSPNLNPAKNGQKREPASGHALPAQAGGQLNPDWVEWLMGWPIEWTGLKPLEMDRFQQWQQQHSEFCHKV